MNFVQSNRVSTSHHGLNLCAEEKNGISLKQMKEYINQYFHLSSTVDKYLIAVKSKDAEEIVRELGIPRMNILLYGATHKEITNDVRTPCHHHTISKDSKIVCSLNTVIRMYEWYREGGWKVCRCRSDESV